MKTLKIDVQVQPKSYEINIGYNVMNEIVQSIKQNHFGNRLAIITDRTVQPLHAQEFYNEMKTQSLDVEIFAFPAGETFKTRATKDWLDDQLLNHHFGRDCVIVAIGGGVVGDIAGFVASTYMRGVPCIQIPTTTIAQGDSSIGGKTAIDVPQGKNLIGAFFHPKIVYIDIKTLTTLDRRNYISGLIEIVKHGFIRSIDLYNYIIKNIDLITERSSDKYPQVMMELMAVNCAIKNEVVQADETEIDLRKILNYGHTVGHAVEYLSNYTLLHGEAISIGIACEAFFSYKLGKCSQDDFLKQVNLIKKMGLPYQIPVGMQVSSIMESMCMDKKARLYEPEFVILESIGKTYVTENGKNALRINKDLLISMINEFMNIDL